MAENMNKQDIENDELICPITLQLFRDPVKAKDGHVYDRDAITRWILQHGTSPLTRQPLDINDLQPDERLKNLARQRRNSTVSYNSYNNTVTLPSFRIIPGNSSRVAPMGIINPVGINSSPNKYRFPIILCIIFCVVVPVSIIISISLPANNNSQTNITSIYSGNLTSNSSTLNRTNLFHFPQICYYDAIQVHISVDGTYQFQSNSLIHMLAYFYQNSFNSTSLYSNLLAYNDVTGINNQFYFQISLNSSINYILVATTYYSRTTGSFLVYVMGPTAVTFD